MTHDINDNKFEFSSVLAYELVSRQARPLAELLL